MNVDEGDTSHHKVESFVQALARGHIPTLSEVQAMNAQRSIQRRAKTSPRTTTQRRLKNSGNEISAESFYDDYQPPLYDDDSPQFDYPKAFSFEFISMNSKAPTVTPTMNPVASVPTMTPTAPPTLNNGWFYYYQFTTDATCQSSPDYVYGTRMGICFPSYPDDDAVTSPTQWVVSSCSSTSKGVTLTQQFYGNADCSGQSTSIQVINLNTIDTGNDDDYHLGACIEYFCTTQTDLPLPVYTEYVVTQDYEDYAGDMCYNPITFQAVLNNKCIQTNPQQWTNTSFPNVYSYNMPDCQGTPTSTLTLDAGCDARSNAEPSVTTLSEVAAPSLSWKADLFGSMNALMSGMTRPVAGASSADDDFPGAASSVSLIVVQPSVDSSSNSLSTGAIVGIIIGSVVGVMLVVFALLATGVIGSKAMVLGNGFGGGYGGAMDSNQRNARSVEMNNPPAANPMYFNKDQV
jgi:hypothetical protein